MCFYEKSPFAKARKTCYIIEKEFLPPRMQKEQQVQTKPSQLTETVSRPTGIKMALLLFWEFIKLIAVGKSLPGIMVANIVLLFGYQLAGPLGGILSAVGLCVPAVVVMTVVTAIYDLIKNNYWVFAALKGVQCAVVPIIGSAAISLSKEALKDKIAIGLCLAALCICLFTSISNLVLVIGGAVLGLVWMGVKEHD